MSEIELNESYTNLELYEWYIIDAQGFETNVKLSDVDSWNCCRK